MWKSRPCAWREEIRFQTKPAIALELIRIALKREIPVGVVLTDAAYGTDTKFREALAGLGLFLCSGNHVLGYGMETGARTATRSHLERTVPPYKISSPRPTACTGCGKTFGSGVAAASLEESLLAPSSSSTTLQLPFLWHSPFVTQ